MFTSIISLLVIATFLYLLYKYITLDFDYWTIRNIEHVKPIFPFGNFQHVLFGRESLGAFVENVYRQVRSDVAGFWIFGTPALLVRAPEIIRHILVKDFNHFYDRTMFSDPAIDPIGPKTLFVLKNPDWKLTRTKVTPFFTASRMKSMLPLLQSSGDDMVGYLRNSVGDVDAKELCAKYATDVISSCAFGVNSLCFKKEDAPFRKAGKQMFGINLTNGLQFLSYFLMPALVKAAKLPIYNKQSTDFLKDVFLRAVQERERTQIVRNDLIDIIIQIKNDESLADKIKFEGDTVVAQALQFYIAGFETTSSTISYVLYQMCFNPDVQNKLRDELLEHNEQGGCFSYDNLMGLSYMGKVISEALRMYPPLPFLDRRCMQDYKVPDVDLIIKKGTAVYFSMLGLHYDHAYFPDPYVFDPERFSEENVANRPTYAYLPFGHGPRNCIGERFGIMATKMCLANILMNFEVQKSSNTPETIEFNPFTIILQPNHDLPMRFVPLKRQCS